MQIKRKGPHGISPLAYEKSLLALNAAWREMLVTEKATLPADLPLFQRPPIGAPLAL
jgi:hypothetical protein